MEIFSKEDLHNLYDQLAERDNLLKMILVEYSYPPLWIRPNSFETLVLTILEQQVSLASAYAAYKKLKERTEITANNLLQLTDEDLRNCYLSRQKTIYTKALANAIINKEIDLDKFENLSDEEVRNSLIKLKGIGNWTIDIYLIHALQRTDVFPVGDLALINAIKMATKQPQLTKEEILIMSQKWKPYRSIATMLFWHYYIKKKNIKLLH